MTIRSRRKRNSRVYFGKEHEEAILAYNRSKDVREKELLYTTLIQPAFSEMVDKIVYTYKFTTLPNIEVLKEDCKLHLTTIIHKYSPEKKSKAFSYFSVITKNWFIQKVKKNKSKNRKEVDLDELTAEHQLLYACDRNKYEEERQNEEFWDLLWREIEAWETMKLKANEEKVLKAIKILIQDRDNPELIFNKKAIYLYIREITGLNTKQVVNNLNKLREKYKQFKFKWDEGRL